MLTYTSGMKGITKTSYSFSINITNNHVNLNTLAVPSSDAVTSAEPSLERDNEN